MLVLSLKRSITCRVQLCAFNCLPGITSYTQLQIPSRNLSQSSVKSFTPQLFQVRVDGVGIIWSDFLRDSSKLSCNGTSDLIFSAFYGDWIGLNAIPDKKQSSSTRGDSLKGPSDIHYCPLRVLTRTLGAIIVVTASKTDLDKETWTCISCGALELNRSTASTNNVNNVLKRGSLAASNTAGLRRHD